jgi:16S rRNA (cytosine1402-N4)-methyltransferase
MSDDAHRRARDDESFAHVPVMVDEITELFGPVPAGTVVDATLGGGGHAAAILTAHPHLDVLGIDRDADALAAARRRLAEFGPRIRTWRGRFDQLDEALSDAGIAPERDQKNDREVDQQVDRQMDEGIEGPRRSAIDTISGALFDLGVSSPQLDRANRGFSYRHDGPLDMRMDDSAPWSASDIVNGYEERELARVIRRYGDERFARRIAGAICAARPVQSTVELAEIVTTAIPAAARRTGGHPAKRTFQAIRIEVNSELEVLPDAIDRAVEATVPGGRIAVLSYHSGEDRIVKQRFVEALGACDCPSELPCVCGAVQTVRVVRGVGKRPSADEIAANRRAGSARLRVVERIEPVSKADGRPVTAARRQGDA